MKAIKAIGTISLLVGLLLMAAAVALEVVEIVIARQEIKQEIADLDDEVKRI